MTTDKNITPRPWHMALADTVVIVAEDGTVVCHGLTGAHADFILAAVRCYDIIREVLAMDPTLEDTHTLKIIVAAKLAEVRRILGP